MQELLPGYADLSADGLLPVTLTNTRNLLEAVLDPLADPSRTEDYFRVSGETRIRQGITADALLQAWRIGVESVREEAHTVAGRLGIPDHVLLEFVEATLQWGDVGMRVSARAHREAEIAELERLAAEQAALRRVATLAAQGVHPAELFSAVGQEVARLFAHLENPIIPTVIRFDPGPELVLVGGADPIPDLPVGSRWKLTDLHVSTRVFRTGRSARVDEHDLELVGDEAVALLRPEGYAYQVGSPIIVEGRLWGAITISCTGPLPADTGERLEKFTELVATAIANAESREALLQLADEQAALRRVATLVAEGVAAAVLFDAVAAEVAQLLSAHGVTLSRYEPGDEVTVLAHRGPDSDTVPPGTRVSYAEGESVTANVWRTKRPARFVHVGGAPGAIPALAQKMSVQTAVGAPIVVERRVWGCIVANWRADALPPASTEERMAKFAELLDTAIANADSRDQLAASRARLVTEADEARRRVVLDLHDGAQQRLVHAIVSLKHAQRALRVHDEKLASLISEALERAQQANAELRELAHGILPAVLTQGGLRSGVNTIISRLDLPVEVDIPAKRLPPDIEASAYFVVAEALTNVVKHSRAEHAQVSATADGGTLQVQVRDDGVGGADPDGHGLVGLADRVTALGGRLEVQSPTGGGTLVSATLPLATR